MFKLVLVVAAIVFVAGVVHTITRKQRV